MIKLIIAFKRRQGMSVEAFRNHCRDVHTPLLLSIPEAGKIKRFVVSCPLPEATEAEPAYDAIVEVCFDDQNAMDTMMASENFRDRVDPDHQNFIDFSTVVRLVTEEVVCVPQQE